MHTVTSRDGTPIAYDRLGSGPALVMVGGALQHRALDRVIGRRAEALARHFTVYHYDRRGRGDSGDTPPYAVAREVEDLAAVIEAAGGAASVLGMSSGGALALEAAAALGPMVRRLALFEVPYDDAPAARESWARFAPELRALLAEGRREDALARFMRQLGTPPAQIAAMRQSPIWPLLLSAAPTLAYDIAVLGEENAIPAARLARVEAPALVLDGGASFAFTRATADALAGLLPHAARRTLAGETHAVSSDALASALAELLAD